MFHSQAFQTDWDVANVAPGGDLLSMLLTLIRILLLAFPSVRDQLATAEKIFHFGIDPGLSTVGALLLVLCC